MLKFFTLISLFGFLNAGLLNVEDCGTAAGSKLVTLDVVGCNAVPCTFIKNSYVQINAQFLSSFNATGLTLKCTASKLFINLPVPLPESNVCVLGANCPVTAGDVNNISFSIQVLGSYPSVSADVKCQVYDQNNNSKVCLKLPVKITN